jgi:hypothetical protein
VLREAIRGFSDRTLAVARHGRRIAATDGIALADLRPCETRGADRTQLAGSAKLYPPVGDRPPSERPFAFVLAMLKVEGSSPFSRLRMVRQCRPFCCRGWDHPDRFGR